MFLKALKSELVRSAADAGSGGDAAAAAVTAPADAVEKSLYPNDQAKPDGGANPPADAKDVVDQAKAPDGKKEDSKDDNGEKPVDLKPDEVPEDGKYSFTLKDGVEIDAAFAEKSMPVLKEIGVSRAGGDKLAGLYAEAREAESKALQEQWDRTQQDWVASAKADKEIGGDKFDASVAVAKRAMDKFGTPELLEYLTASGGGNHPEMIRFVARVGNAFSDDKPIGSNATPVAKDAAAILYPND